jgi:hypothetical protein
MVWLMGEGFNTGLNRFNFVFLFLQTSVYFLDEEYFVFVQPVVDREFSGLTKSLVAAGVLALVGLVSRVHVQVVLEILCQGEALPTELASEPPAWIMGRDVPSQTILVGVFLSTVEECAWKSSM